MTPAFVRRPACLLLAIALMAPPVGAQVRVTRTTPSEAAVDAVFKRYDGKDTPGCSVAVIDDGKVLLKKSYGMADPSLGVPRTSATSHWIPYSEARVFVALAVAMLARDGKVSWDDLIRKHVPQVPAYASAVTLRQLLHHTSGLADYGVLVGPGVNIEDRLSEDEFFRILARWNKLGFAPGQGHMYSNTDYALLKIVVERVSGVSLHDHLHTRLLGPLGMANTRIGADQADVHPGHSLFYDADGDGFRRLLRYRINPVGQISVTTSLDDLIRWDGALRDPTSGLAAMLKQLEVGAPPREVDADVDGYSFGVYRRSHEGLPLVEYRGVGWFTYLLQVADTRLSVATLCQTNQETGWLGAEVARLYASPAPVKETETKGAAPAPPPRTLGTSVNVPMAELERYIGEYRSTNGRAIADVTLTDNMLVIAPRGRAAFPKLAALGNGQFKTVIDGSTTLLEFKDSNEGGMTLSSWDITLNESGGDTLHRWTPWQPDAKALQDYAGTYVGEDIEVILHVRSEGGRVLMASRGMAETALNPSNKPDHFDDPTIFTTRFERDASGRVVALVLDATRVKGMRYTKK